MTKEQLIEKYGKNDGFDEDRWLMAIDMSGMVDHSVSTCFISLLNLEDKGLIELVIPE